MMQTIGRIFSGISGSLDLNKATLSGALDVVVIQHPDGSLHSTQFHVRFGKLKLLKSSEKTVKIKVNEKPTQVRMKLGQEGEAFFVEKAFEDTEEELITSPILSPKHKTAENQREDNQKRSVFRSITSFFKKSKKPRSPLPVTPNSGDLEEVFDSEETQSDADISLCGHLVGKSSDLNQVFAENKVSFKDFKKNPWEILSNPNLMVRIENKLYDYQSAIPIIISELVFQRDIEEPTPKPNCCKQSLSLPSSELQKLKLQPGKNKITYTIKSRIQGEHTLEGRIYLWDSRDKIVISDIDGTITRSDVLGHILPMVGKDWSHPGVVSLYQTLKARGYNIMYLSSRAIGQAKTTKNYLESVLQGEQGLPDGPILLSPDRLFRSFVREVIKKVPQKFKAGMLKEVRSLFPAEVEPFFAGFGNRDTDAIAYRAAGVPLEKIFIVNPEGRIYVFDGTEVNSYLHLEQSILEVLP